MNDDLKNNLIKAALGIYGLVAGGELSGEPMVAGAVGIGGVVLGIIVQVGRAAVKYFVDQAATDRLMLEALSAMRAELNEQSTVLHHLAYRMGHPIGPHGREAPTAPPVVLRAAVDVGRAS